MPSHASFSNFYEYVCQCLKRKGFVEEISNDFSRLTTDGERFKFVSTLMSQYQFRPLCLDVKVLTKCRDESLRLRSEGNEAFIKRKEKIALNLYSRSALFAPGGIELSMAYANRSAVLAAMKYFRDAVADVERAIGLCYPEHLKYKLIKRKAECLCMLGTHSEAQDCYRHSLSLLKSAKLSEEKLKETELKLMESLKECCCHGDDKKLNDLVEDLRATFNENEEVPCASVSVAISYTESLGRHIVATKLIDPGEVIALEEPFASILLPEYYLSHCYHCLRRRCALIPCWECCHTR